MHDLAVITGTTHGIGHETALELARAGRHVVMLCRNVALADDTAARIRRLHPESPVDVVHCDLADLRSVRDAALRVRREFGPPSLLILNAGMASTSRRRTATGMDLNFAVNHLGHFLLVELLRARMAPKGRIITVASLAHRYGRLDLEAVVDPHERIGAIASYARSKLANVLHSQALSRRLAGSGITANCLHPGIVATHLLPRWVQVIQRLVRRQMFDAARGARTTLKLALADDLATCSGLYFDEFGEACEPADRARDQVLQEALWVRSLQWVDDWLASPGSR